MSYHTIIRLTETLSTKLQGPAPAEETFEEAYGELEELLEETRDASYHRTEDPDVRDRFSSLHGQLASFARRLQAGDYHKQTWRTLQELIHISERIAAAQPDPGRVGGALLDLDDALALLREDPAALRDQARQELRADPESVIGAFLLGAAHICLEEYADAIAVAGALAIRYPARHVSTIAAAAAAMQGRAEVARQWALDGLHRRLEARRPQPWQRVPGLRTLNDEEAEVIRQANVYLVQRTLHWIQDHDWEEPRRFILTGLLAPSLTQARYMLDRAEDETDDGWIRAAQCGLARCARWRCAFMEAREHLDGIDLPFATVERTLIDRDRDLIASGEVELFGFGTRLRLGRTTDSTGFAVGDEDLTLTEYSDRDEAQVADLLKDYVVSWVNTGFHHTVTHRGPLTEEDLGAADEDDLPSSEPEAVFDVEHFFQLYSEEDLAGIHKYAEAVTAQHPYAPTPWAAAALVHLIQGRWDQAARASRQGTMRSGCRALAAPQVLLPLAEEDYGRALATAMDNLSLRLRSATPEAPLVLPGYPHITRSEGELLDQIEHNTWRMAEELLEEQDPEGEEQALELRLIQALITPNPATTIEELGELMPELSGHLGLQSAACVAMARWRRHEGRLDEADEWLGRAEQLLPSLSYTRAERRRLRRDRGLMRLEEVTLRGFGVTIEISRAGRLLHRHFTPDHTAETHALTGWIEDSREQATALALRDVAVSWLESGFALLSDAPGE